MTDTDREKELKALMERDAKEWQRRQRGNDLLIELDGTVGTADVRFDSPRMVEAAE